MRTLERDQTVAVARSPDDGGQILALIALFTGATLLVVGAVWALTVVTAWWMLAVAIAIHLATTSVVLIEVARVIGERHSAPSGRRRRHDQARTPKAASEATPSTHS